MHDARPVIITRDHHTLSRRLISGNALKVMYRLKEKGFTAYLVGGGVRDLLLGREPKDFDIATDATPAQIKRIFRNCRLVGRRFRLAHLYFDGEIVEVATFRSGVPELLIEEGPPLAVGAQPAEVHCRAPRHLKTDDGLILRDNVFGSPAEDALRRDFTVNALCYTIADFSLIDYVGGMKDLQQGIIRTIGDPLQRFVEDPVRMLRAVRFAAMLGFEIEEKTWQAILELAHTVTRSAPPRLYEEVLKLFLSGNGERTFQLMRQTGLFAALFPAFDKWLSTESEGFPHVRAGQALAWIDDCLTEKENVPPQLLIVLMFGQYLEEQAAEIKKSGGTFQQALDQAVAHFVEELSPTVFIPHRTALQVRDIISYQLRFQKTPGRHAPAFLARPEFKNALTYLRFRGCLHEENSSLHAWWEKFLAESPVIKGEEPRQQAAANERRKPRRRRRRKRPKSGVDLFVS